jgi:hypothetical protein
MPEAATTLNIETADYGITLQFPGDLYPRSFPRGPYWQIIPSPDGTTVTVSAINSGGNAILYDKAFGDIYTDGVAYTSMDDLLNFLTANIY